MGLPQNNPYDNYIVNVHMVHWDQIAEQFSDRKDSFLHACIYRIGLNTTLGKGDVIYTCEWSMKKTYMICDLNIFCNYVCDTYFHENGFETKFTIYFQYLLC